MILIMREMPFLKCKTLLSILIIHVQCVKAQYYKHSVFKSNWLLCCRCIGGKANYLNIIWKMVCTLNCVNTNRQLFFLSTLNVMYKMEYTIFNAIFQHFSHISQQFYREYHTITYIIIVLNSLLKLTLTAPQNTSSIKHPMQSKVYSL